METKNLQSERAINTKRIVIYLLITFVLTYCIEIFIIMPLSGSADINMAYLAFALTVGVMFIPAFGAIVTRFLTKEKFTRSNIMVIPNIKGNLKYYGIAWFGFAILIVFGAVLYFLIFPKQFDSDLGYYKIILAAQSEREWTVAELRQSMVMQIIMGIVISPFVNFVNCFGEEWGWRGYLLPKMMKQFKIVPTLLITGLIWGVWHAPLIITGHNYGVGYRGFPVVGIIAMCMFCTVIGIVLSYVTIKTKSCIPAVVGHAVLNGLSSTGVYYTSLKNPYNVFLGPMPIGVIGGMGFIILAGVLLFLLYKEEKQSPEGLVL